MDVSKVFTKRGDIYAVWVEDGDSARPMFLDVLKSDIMVPELMKSGYLILSATPFNISRNGITMSGLPREEWTPVLEAKYGQDMYDEMSRCRPMTDVELRPHLYAGTGGMTFPVLPSYKYNTREEFLAYLDSIAINVPYNDVCPLNYIVHPAARFSISEYLSSENTRYRDIIASRRRFSWQRLCGCIQFLRGYGLPEKYSFKDFLAAYLQWGIDGVSFTYKGTAEVKDQLVNLNAAVWDEATHTYRNIPGWHYKSVMCLVVRRGSSYEVMCPTGYNKDQLVSVKQAPAAQRREEPWRTMRFRLEDNELKIFDTLQEGNAMICPRLARAPKSTWEVSPEDACALITVSDAGIDFGGIRSPSFTFYSDCAVEIPAVELGDNHAIKQRNFAHHLAYIIADKSVVKSLTSFYDLLTLNMGFSPRSALLYTVMRMGMNDYMHPVEIEDYDAAGDLVKEYAPVITVDHVDAFVRAMLSEDSASYEEAISAIIPHQYDPHINGHPYRDPFESMFGKSQVKECEVRDEEEVSRNIVDTLTDIVNGEAGDGELGAAVQDDHGSPDSLYLRPLSGQLSCGSVSMQEALSYVNNWKVGTRFQLGSAFLPVIEMNATANTIKKLEVDIRIKMASNARYLVWVNGAILQPGDDSAGQHIGFLCSIVDNYDKRVREAVSKFAYAYALAVFTDLSPIRKTRPQEWLKMVNTFFPNPAGMYPFSAVVDIDALEYYSTHPNGLDPNIASAMELLNAQRGQAQFVAAQMFMQALCTGSFAMVRPSAAGGVDRKAEPVANYPELEAAVNKVRNAGLLVGSGANLYCDCQSFCDNMLDDQNDTALFNFYVTNASITTTRVNPRAGFTITQLNPLFQWGVEQAIKFANLPDPEANMARIFYGKNPLSADMAGNYDLIRYVTSHRVDKTSLVKTSMFRAYMSKLINASMMWKFKNPLQRISGFTSLDSIIWQGAECEAYAAGVMEAAQSPFPGFSMDWKPAYDKYRRPIKDTEQDSFVKPYHGVLADEYASGVDLIEPPTPAGKSGILSVIGGFITATTVNNISDTRDLNASDVEQLDPAVYPVKHIYGNRYLICTIDGVLYSVEV